MMDKLIPNSFQHPNLYIDRLAYFLTPAENVVLAKAIREILGWQDKIENRRARIALSIFVDGKFNKDGKRLCYGCGISESGIRKALVVLDRFGILKKEDISNDGQLFYLPCDENAIDWAELEHRRQKWDEKNTKRTEKARVVLSDKRGTVTQQGVLSDKGEGVLSDKGEGVLSDKDKETHVKSMRNTCSTPDSGEEKTGEPLVEEYFGQRPDRGGDPLATKPWVDKLMDSPWLVWHSDHVYPQAGISAESLQHVGWMIENLTGLCPVDGELKGWLKVCVTLHQIAKGNWTTLERGIRKVWDREEKYRPGHIRGFVDEVRKAASAKSETIGW